GVTTYCNSFCVFGGTTASAVTSNTWRAVEGLLPRIKLGFNPTDAAACAGSKYSKVVESYGGTFPCIWFTSICRDCSVAGVIRTHLNGGPGIPPAVDTDGT